MTAVTGGQQLARGKFKLLLPGPCSLGQIWAHPVAAYRGIWEPPARVEFQRDPLAEGTQLWYLWAGRWGRGSPSFCCQGHVSLFGCECTQWGLTEEPGSQAAGSGGLRTGNTQLWCMEVSSWGGRICIYCCRICAPLEVDILGFAGLEVCGQGGRILAGVAAGSWQCPKPV